LVEIGPFNGSARPLLLRSTVPEFNEFNRRTPMGDVANLERMLFEIGDALAPLVLVGSAVVIAAAAAIVAWMVGELSVTRPFPELFIAPRRAVAPSPTGVLPSDVRFREAA
jgi:hypothetical protein